MELNTAMRFVMMRARAEQAHVGAGELWPEHIFCGILKLSELSADEGAPGSSHTDQIAEDISDVRSHLREQGIDSAKIRNRIRIVLKLQQGQEREDSIDVEQIKTKAEEIAEKKGMDAVSAMCYLEALLAIPTTNTL